MKFSSIKALTARLRWAGDFIRKPVSASLNMVFKSDFLYDKGSITLDIRNWQTVASYSQQLRVVIYNN